MRTWGNQANRRHALRRARAARPVAVVGGEWLQFDRGDCSCGLVHVWLYAPVVSPDSKVCGACVQGLVNAGLRESAA
jgi:hypothetical protein